MWIKLRVPKTALKIEAIRISLRGKYNAQTSRNRMEGILAGWIPEMAVRLCQRHGGTLFIGKDDDGNVVGIQGSKKLLEDLPNKITNALGIIADMNLRTENGKDYLEIVVDKYPFLISYHGRYYYRSGSVLREIVGKELERALLRSQGLTVQEHRHLEQDQRLEFLDLAYIVFGVIFM